LPHVDGMIATRRLHFAARRHRPEHWLGVAVMPSRPGLVGLPGLEPTWTPSTNTRARLVEAPRRGRRGGPLRSLRALASARRMGTRDASGSSFNTSRSPSGRWGIAPRGWCANGHRPCAVGSALPLGRDGPRGLGSHRGLALDTDGRVPAGPAEVPVAVRRRGDDQHACASALRASAAGPSMCRSHPISTPIATNGTRRSRPARPHRSARRGSVRQGSPPDGAPQTTPRRRSPPSAEARGHASAHRLEPRS